MKSMGFVLRLELLEKEKHELMLKLQALENTILGFKNSGNADVNLPPEIFDYGNKKYEGNELFAKYYGYYAAQPTRNKVIQIIKTENRFLHVREIARIACQLEKQRSAQSLIRNISPALSLLKRMPGSPVTSIRIFNSHFNTFWGCSNWLTDEGKALPKFMYNEAEIKKCKTNYFFTDIFCG